MGKHAVESLPVTIYVKYIYLPCPMPYKEKDIEKIYYTIGEVAEMLQLSPSVLRYWEKEFSHLHPRKNHKGDRLYTHADIDKIKLIQHLLRDCGYTVEGARQQLHLRLTEQERKWKTIESLQRLRQFLVQLRDTFGDGSRYTSADEQTENTHTPSE
ncbi:MAG: MerR family transcriptional regulator [Chitinophagales bacterium]|nr:MerR family transcriptional regulator [Chitinophagales bacterium]MDW8419269.1 MerR family transcriptional regulator [Chitinophagales bacterium]